MRDDGKKALPLTVSADGRTVNLPARSRVRGPRLLHLRVPRPAVTNEDKNKTIGVTYSSINGNGFGGYGETVLGTKGTLILEREQEVMLFKDADHHDQGHRGQGQGRRADARHHRQRRRPGGRQSARRPSKPGPPSRGYTEEMEHWAWCIRNPDPTESSRAAIRRSPWATP